VCLRPGDSEGNELAELSCPSNHASDRAASCKNTRMASDKSALVLLHGLTMSSETAWRDVVPLLADHHQVHVPNALGHRGGPSVQQHPVTMNDVVDAAEHYLDERGLDRPHLAGNSMGAFMAIELARRERAATVCALAPPGLWSSGDGLQARSLDSRGRVLGRLMRPAFPLMFRRASVRRFFLRGMAVHGDRLTPAQAVEIVNDALDGAILDDLSADEWHIAPLDPSPCPITVVWSEKDAVLPMAEYARALPERLPQATFEVLAGVGHVPMIDDPGLVATTILAVTGAAKN
jgi:pimeloyl-ACP methyl ester carboxylesterase